MSYEVEAHVAGTRAGKAHAGDRLLIKQKVIPAVPVRTFQAILAQIDPEWKLKVEAPKDALPGRGGVSVSLQPTILTGLAGVVQYMKDYAYDCLEQRTSKAIALRDEVKWSQTMKDLPSYLDRDGLAKYFPTAQLSGSEVLTTYLLAISQEAGWEIPSQYRERMMEGLKKFVTGVINREGALPTVDLTLRKIAAIEALSRWGEASSGTLSGIEATPISGRPRRCSTGSAF